MGSLGGDDRSFLLGFSWVRRGVQHKTMNPYVVHAIGWGFPLLVTIIAASIPGEISGQDQPW